jgi:hypothetical protein
MFIHEVDPLGQIHRYWLEAERSKHKVGGAQVETKEEKEAAAARGKAVATFIGTRAMGTRFNVQMLIQLPVVQKPRPPRYISTLPVSSLSGGYGSANECMLQQDTLIELDKLKKTQKAQDAQLECLSMCLAEITEQNSKISDCLSSSLQRASKPAQAPPKVGTSNAARVSRGSEEDTWKGLTKKDVRRDCVQHGTITVTMYYTVVGGIPSVDDVKAAVADLDQLYKACPSDKKLVNCTEITSELTVKNMQDITTKVTTQAYQPPVKKIQPVAVSSFPE